MNPMNNNTRSSLLILALAAISTVIPLKAETKQTLQSLEFSAIKRATNGASDLSKEDSQKILRAATAFAETLEPQSDEAFANLVIDARERAILAKTSPLATGRDLLSQRELLPQIPRDQRVWASPELNRNYRALVEKAAVAGSELFPVTGPSAVARVVGPGTVEADGRFPDCVAVGSVVNGTNRFCCTGTLIADNVVVTAGHCFFCIGGGAATAVVFVGNNITKEGKTYRGRAIVHPEYGENGAANDLALIFLDEKVTGVKPRKLASSSQIDALTFVRVVGFGNSNYESTSGFGVKRMVDTPIASVGCRGDHQAKYGCNEGKELVAGFLGLGPDSCNGDSGGPIYALVGEDARDDEAWLLVGATSRATAGASRPCGDGGIYERLDAFLDFLGAAAAEER
jgi:hypothetical protein